MRNRLFLSAGCRLLNSVVRYRFILENGQSFDFQVDRQRVFNREVDATRHEFWTRLEFSRCDNCPLAPASFGHCPVAVDIERIAVRFKNILSFERVQVEVQTPERFYAKPCDAQTGLRSLLGLVMATSACPILGQFRALAATHLPFATMEETLFRSAGAYLLRQYFIFKEGGAPDWDLRHLEQFYQELQTVNRCLNGRLVAASQKDANLNAIGALLYVSLGVSFSLEDNLRELRPLFYPEGGPSAASDNLGAPGTL